MKSIHTIVASVAGQVVKITIDQEDNIRKGQELLILEAMKMENVISSQKPGIVSEILVSEGDVVNKGQDLILIHIHIHSQETLDDPSDVEAVVKENIFDRKDLQVLIERKKFLNDENRPQAVEKQRKRGHNTARENLKKLIDEGSLNEMGSLVVAAQRTRRTEDELIKKTPADGLIAGTASINGRLFHNADTQCIVMAYDYTVLAGTQGTFNHLKMDRMLQLAEKNELPVILFAEGGGGRPGDVDVQMVAGLHIMTFHQYARLKGKVPLIAIVSGYCFAGNAALAGSSDILIATKDASIGMGGPAMIEGGGLGKFHPKEVGPADMQVKNGVIDILTTNEDEAIHLAQKMLGIFQGSLPDWEIQDQKQLRHFVPQNRKRSYDVKEVINILADKESVIELKSDFACGMITCFIRIEGQPMGVLANNSSYQAGAITSENAIKACGFLTLCSQNKIPVLSLVDTPGIMVGPEAEKTGTVRHASQLFVIGSQLGVPIFALVLRKGYGLGAMAMTGGSFHATQFIVSWPTGEFGAMGLEGAVRLGYRKELETVQNPVERKELYDRMVTQAYERGTAMNMASFHEIDDVIDPADSRSWLIRGLKMTKYFHSSSR